MKSKLNLFLLTVGLTCGLLILPACGGNKQADAESHGHEHQYTCAHHPEVVKDSPGTCPKCSMKLTVKPH